MNLSVINRKTTPGGIYIGRPSILGNPYKIGRDGDRTAVIQKYRRGREQEVQRRGAVWEELRKLAARVASGEAIELACWCAPEPCHGDAIKSCLEWIIRERLY
ncbi:DUF4326 domain-containing protein [Oscillatoriales cyanobacterium LEGE 11467]|uniref:DUF4326 domain-containing protein n=1 Tax=Zarconia navalis LEGE 11467 TaxID=1828826 RepID=A0A928Z7M8_9CYAN|nr:DUF4326 domain-containing protein [Zarconia navalis]MBE9040705.1 DUF4326 domain-containing protein [Zarconia navalis LEGE 11467]